MGNFQYEINNGDGKGGRRVTYQPIRPAKLLRLVGAQPMMPVMQFCTQVTLRGRGGRVWRVTRWKSSAITFGVAAARARAGRARRVMNFIFATVKNYKCSRW